MENSWEETETVHSSYLRRVGAEAEWEGLGFIVHMMALFTHSQDILITTTHKEYFYEHVTLVE